MIKLVTLRTGISLIGDYTENDDSFYLKTPVQAIPMPPKGTNDPGAIAFAPYLHYTEEFSKGIKFDQKEILTVNTPINSILEQYDKVFGKGVDIVKPGTISVG
jgi:hypothetical protein